MGCVHLTLNEVAAAGEAGITKVFTLLNENFEFNEADRGDINLTLKWIFDQATDEVNKRVLNTGSASKDNPIPDVNALRAFGGLIILLSIVEVSGLLYCYFRSPNVQIGVGWTAFWWMTSVHDGAWWAGVSPIIAVVLRCISSNQTTVVVAYIFAFCGYIAAFTGAIMDGFAVGVVAYEKGCINTKTFEVWGSSEGKADAALCAEYANGNYSYYFNYNYYNYNNYNTYSYWDEECICANNGVCHGYTLSQGNNCGEILTTYTNLLIVSATTVSTLTLVMTIFPFVLSLFCMHTNENCSTTAPVPIEQTVQMTSPQAKPYAIQPDAKIQFHPLVCDTVPAYLEALNDVITPSEEKAMKVDPENQV